MANSGHLSKEFFELVRAIGESRSKQEEDKIIREEEEGGGSRDLFVSCVVFFSTKAKKGRSEEWTKLITGPLDQIPIFHLT